MITTVVKYIHCGAMLHGNRITWLWTLPCAWCVLYNHGSLFNHDWVLLYLAPCHGLQYQTTSSTRPTKSKCDSFQGESINNSLKPVHAELFWGNINIQIFYPFSKLWRQLDEIPSHWRQFNSFTPEQNGRHFPDDIFMNENVRIAIQISFKFVPKALIDNKSASVQVMAWRRTGDKPLPEPKLTQFADAYMRH